MRIVTGLLLTLFMTSGFVRAKPEPFKIQCSKQIGPYVLNRRARSGNG